MTHPADDKEFQARMRRLESLLQDAERGPEPRARERLREVVQTLLDLHGAGLAKILSEIHALGADGHAAIETLARDELVGGLLLLHGLHPESVEERVREALDQVRPYLRSHGGNVELLEVGGGVVRLRLEGSCDGCPSSAATMSQTIEEAILAKAPDVTVVEVEGLTDGPPATADGRPLVALPLV